MRLSCTVFGDIASRLSKGADFYLPDLYLVPRRGGGVAGRISRTTLPSENYIPSARVAFLRDPVFSGFDTIPACDRRTDRIASRGKNWSSQRRATIFIIDRTYSVEEPVECVLVFGRRRRVEVAKVILRSRVT